MRKKMIFFLCLLFLCIPSAAADEFAGEHEVIKIRMDGTVKRSKEFGSGNGIEFVLPEFQDPAFYLYSVELAVFEQFNGTDWHIYTDAEGRESKRRLIEQPQSLKIQVDFGKTSDYRTGARYKIGYRYHLRSIDDLSQFTIAGGAEKEGWRLVGESDPVQASEQGFLFHVNYTPSLTIDSLSFQREDINGGRTQSYTSEQLAETWLPQHALAEGITVQYTALDTDQEDLLTVSYKLIDASSKTTLAQGILEDGGTIQSTAPVDEAALIFSVIDSWGASYTLDPLPIHIDRELPQVTSAFDDQGCAVKGLNLYSQFTITDDMGNGEVYYSVLNSGNILEQHKPLLPNGNGIYVVDAVMPQSGEYEILLTLFDQAGNKALYSFYQTLDAAAPVVTLLSNGSYTWTNQPEDILYQAADQHAGILGSELYEDGVYHSFPLDMPESEHTFAYPVQGVGKIPYILSVYDSAMPLDKVNNTVSRSNGSGNRTDISTEMWVDRTVPFVAIEADEEQWYHTPSTFQIRAADYESVPGAGDCSGLKSLEYCVTDTPVPDDNWKRYPEQGVEITQSGVHYLHARAIDIAGNIQTATKMVHFNTSSVLLRNVEPTEDSAYTIYQRTTANGVGVYVAKNTAYQTKYHFALLEEDLQDMIQVDIALTGEDGQATKTSVTVPPTGDALRNVSFPISYLQEDGTPLPDGVYQLCLTIKEIKNNGFELITHQNELGCEVVIKRSAPPLPQITVTDTGAQRAVEITYPEETLSGGLNRPYIKELYQRQYRITADKSNSTYLNYTAPIQPITRDCLITALYTDPAGNMSTASLRVFAEHADGTGGNPSLRTEGNTVNVEESRPATVYYINTRRDKQAGVNGNALGFLR